MILFSFELRSLEHTEDYTVENRHLVRGVTKRKQFFIVFDRGFPAHSKGEEGSVHSLFLPTTSEGFFDYRGLQGDVVYLSWPIAPLVFEPKCGGGRCGVSANENSCAHHVTWSPNKLWRSNSIFNLCVIISNFQDDIHFILCLLIPCLVMDLSLPVFCPQLNSKLSIRGGVCIAVHGVGGGGWSCVQVERRGKS